MIHYLTVKKEAIAEYEVQRSKFIGRIARVESREEAEAYVAQIRELHRDATHNVAAFIVGEKGEIQWTTDDGEPQGSSGPPILQMLAREGLSNVVCVVTRYFGGIKLGVGGLVRAYTMSAKLALEAAGLHEARDVCSLQVEIPYTALGTFQHLEKDGYYKIEEINYTDKVELLISTEPEDRNRVVSLLSELSAGNVEIKREWEEII